MCIFTFNNLKFRAKIWASIWSLHICDEGQLIARSGCLWIYSDSPCITKISWTTDYDCMRWNFKFGAAIISDRVLLLINYLIFPYHQINESMVSQKISVHIRLSNLQNIDFNIWQCPIHKWCTDWCNLWINGQDRKRWPVLVYDTKLLNCFIILNIIIM